MRRAPITLAVVVAFVVAGCGGSGHRAAASRTVRGVTPTTGTAASAGRARETTTTGAAGAPGPGGTTPPRPGPPAPGPTGVPITGTLASACVRPGGSQTITITTAPDSGVAYDTVYADGKSGISSDYYGGNKGGQTNKSGVWTDTWVISSAAPPGSVRVDIVAATPQGSGTAYASFAMADASGRCPS